MLRRRTHGRGLLVIIYSFHILRAFAQHTAVTAPAMFAGENTTTWRENAPPFSNVDAREDDHKGKSQYFSHVFALPHLLALTCIGGHPARCDRRASRQGSRASTASVRNSRYEVEEDMKLYLGLWI